MSTTRSAGPPFALIVDDDPMILEAAGGIVEQAGFNPLEAFNVAEAIGWLEIHGNAIRLLFTDVQMPGGRDGFSLAKETARRWPEVKILVASGRREPTADDLPSGALFIKKPFSPAVVYDHLNELLPEHVKPGAPKTRIGGIGKAGD